MDERVPKSASLLDENVKGERLQYHCPSCGFLNTVTVTPWAPVIAKHVCAYVNCERTNEVATRETFESHISEHVAEGKDKNKHARMCRAYSTNTEFSKNEAKVFERVKKEARMMERAYGRTTTRTPWGDATLIN